ncbi:hypothetical protein [Streptomyces sp. NBC_01207]|uniref:hypothetical protein n=1 Tax=Streptomyces sp. NBC_01207 TaxID=2903772 RepID=UPI002E1330F6|nr:hypothetical protein OG457_05680 [Streptomyces sp. NBC_01207]
MKDPFACDDPAMLSASAPADRLAARRAVAAHAESPAECEMLLDMLGLLSGEEPPWTSVSGSARSGE